MFMSYDSGMLSGRWETPQDDGPSGALTPKPEVYKADVVLISHTIWGFLVGLSCLLSDIFYKHSFWLLRFSYVILGLSVFLFLLWVGITGFKNYCPEAVRRQLPKRNVKDEENLDEWIGWLFGATVLPLLVAYTWSWQLKHPVYLSIIVIPIVIFLGKIVADRIRLIFG